MIAFGLVLIMGIAGNDIQQGKLSVGDFVAVNTYLLQLYLPLNFLGWVYREIRQSLIDLERMFGLRRASRCSGPGKREQICT